MTLNEMLLRLHRRLGISTGAQDELLTDLLADANALMLAYLNRAELPAALENAQCQLAVLLYNRLGMEGERARSEGGVTLTVDTLPEDVLDNASYFGRIFARSGGLSDAVAEGLKEQNIDFDLKPCVCDGIEACRMALLKKSKNALDANFIEGMACLGGCIGGAGCLTHGEKNKADVDKYGKQAMEKTILDAISVTDVGPEAE